MKSKPVIHVFHNRLLYGRGAEKYLFEVLTRLSRNHSINLYIEHISPYWRARYRRSRVTVRPLHRPPFLYWLLVPVSIFVNYLTLKRTIATNDIVVATFFPLNLLGVLLSKKTIFLCFEPSGALYDKQVIASFSFRAILLQRSLNSVYRLLDRYAAAQARFLVTLDHSLDAYIVSAYRRNPDAYTSYGVDVKRYQPARHKKKQKKNYLIITHSTDFTIAKGTKIFLRALSQLSKHHMNFHSYITESMINTQEKNRFITYIKQKKLDNHITFVGTLSEQKLIDLYNRSDVFCFSALPNSAAGATASLSVLEAQACGLPVIRSKGNDREIIAGTTGLFFTPYTPSALAATIMQFSLLSSGQIRQMKTMGRQHVREYYSWENPYRILHSCISKLTS